MKNDLTVVTEEEKAFEFLQRKAKAFISGNILPQHYRNIGDVIVLEEMSKSLKIPMVMLAQGLYIVKGKPSMSGQLVIAIINGSGKFDSPLMFEERTSPTWGVRAYAKLGGETLYGEWITDETIKMNGWASNPHWKNNKGLMARYRSASWFGRLYCPELLMGFKTEGEVQDMEVMEAEVVMPRSDINAALMKKAEPRTEPQNKPTKKTMTDTPAKEQTPDETPTSEEAQTRRRVPRYISKYYPALEKLGLKKSDTRKFVEYMDWMEQPADMIDDFFSQENEEIKQYINAFYGISDPDYQEAQIEEELNSDEDIFEQRQEAQPNTPKELMRYRATFMSHGLKFDDFDAFIEWAALDKEGCRELVQDEGGMVAMIEQFNEEMGYAEQR